MILEPSTILASGLRAKAVEWYGSCDGIDVVMDAAVGEAVSRRGSGM